MHGLQLHLFKCIKVADVWMATVQISSGNFLVLSPAMGIKLVWDKSFHHAPKKFLKQKECNLILQGAQAKKDKIVSAASPQNCETNISKKGYIAEYKYQQSQQAQSLS